MIGRPEIQSASPTIVPSQWSMRELWRFVQTGQLDRMAVIEEYRRRPTSDVDWVPGEAIPNRTAEHRAEERARRGFNASAADRRFAEGRVQVFERVRR
jgi:hypothetical protein